MPKRDLATIPELERTGYPPPHNAAVAGRRYRRLGPTAFGVSRVTLAPGAWSSQRHWHEDEDEFVVIVSGEAILIEDAGEERPGPGDCAAFPSGVRDGHHLVNRSDPPCVFVAVGGGTPQGGGYADVDMIFTADGR